MVPAGLGIGIAIDSVAAVAVELLDTVIPVGTGTHGVANEGHHDSTDTRSFMVVLGACTLPYLSSMGMNLQPVGPQ